MEQRFISLILSVTSHINTQEGTELVIQSQTDFTASKMSPIRSSRLRPGRLVRCGAAMDELRHVFPLAREVYDKSAAVQKFIRATELFARALFVPAVHTNTGAARFSPIPEKKPLS